MGDQMVQVALRTGLRCEEMIVDREELIQSAREARQRAYAPYSQYKVGAALLSGLGHVYTGCNVENMSYGLTLCAERVALVKAVSEGDLDFKAIAVVTEDGVSPCGACRQALSEFGLDMEIIISRSEGKWHEVHLLRDLHPRSFAPSH